MKISLRIIDIKLTQLYQFSPRPVYIIGLTTLKIGEMNKYTLLIFYTLID